MKQKTSFSQFNRYLAISASFVASIFFLSSCCSNCSNSPTQASVSLTPISQGNFCNAGSLGSFVANGQGAMRIEIAGDNSCCGQYDAVHNYIGNNNSNPSLSTPNGSGLGSNNNMTAGNSTTADILRFNVPQKNSYTVEFGYVEWGASNPSNGINTNSCSNCWTNGQPMCYRFKIWRKFSKKSYPNSSNTSITFDNNALQGCVPSCGF